MTPATPVQHIQTPQITVTNETPKSVADQSDPKKEPPAKIVKGFLAVCHGCGYTGIDHAKCQRCKRLFTEAPRKVPEPDKPMISPHPPPLVPTASSTPLYTKMPGTAERDSLVGVKGITLQKKPSQSNLGSMLSIRGIGRGSSSAARGGRGRGRSGSSKYHDVEPVVFTLSSDDEDHDSNDNTKNGSNLATTSELQKVSFAGG